MAKLIGKAGAMQGAMPHKVEISGWEDGDTWEVTLRRPGIHEIIYRNMCPNPLLGTVEKLFMGAGGSHVSEDESKAVRVIARAALVEPKLDELEAEGIYLTDMQMMEIYAYVFRGALGLRNFRAAQSRIAGNDGARVADETVGTDGADGSADGVVR